MAQSLRQASLRLRDSSDLPGAVGEPQDPLLISEEIAAFLQVSPRTLARWRQLGSGPPYRRVGRHVRYAWDDVRTWLASLPGPRILPITQRVAGQGGGGGGDTIAVEIREGQRGDEALATPDSAAGEALSTAEPLHE